MIRDIYCAGCTFRGEANGDLYECKIDHKLRPMSTKCDVDIIPVVRCQDCKWFDKTMDMCDHLHYMVRLDWFCANGEKEEETALSKPPRLIDANKAYEVLTDCYHHTYTVQHNALREALNKVPTVEAVPTEFHDKCMAIEIEKRLDMEKVVRCKDCVHCADDWNGNEPQFTCELGKCGESVYPDDYCSWAEKK